MLRAQLGDREAIESLLRSVQPMLTRYVRTIVGGRAAEDVTQAAWIAVVIGSRQASDRQLILLCAFAGAMTVFGGVFMLTLVIYRMTHKLLQAIEISSGRA